MRGLPSPNRGKTPAGHGEGGGSGNEKERSLCHEEALWAVSRKRGNEKKCLHTQEERRQVQNQDRASTGLASWELGERTMLAKRL